MYVSSNFFLTQNNSRSSSNIVDLQTFSLVDIEPAQFISLSVLNTDEALGAFRDLVTNSVALAIVNRLSVWVDSASLVLDSDCLPSLPTQPDLPQLRGLSDDSRKFLVKLVAFPVLSA